MDGMKYKRFHLFLLVVRYGFFSKKIKKEKLFYKAKMYSDSFTKVTKLAGKDKAAVI